MVSASVDLVPKLAHRVISYQLSAISKWLNAINELLLTFSPLKAKS
jgi:hypothetical protein